MLVFNFTPTTALTKSSLWAVGSHLNHKSFSTWWFRDRSRCKRALHAHNLLVHSGDHNIYIVQLWAATQGLVSSRRCCEYRQLVIHNINLSPETSIDCSNNCQSFSSQWLLQSFVSLVSTTSWAELNIGINLHFATEALRHDYKQSGMRKKCWDNNLENNLETTNVGFDAWEGE